MAQLRRVAFAIGAPSSGTKPVLAQHIQRELEVSNSSTAQPGTRVATPTSFRNLSIVSIDMGIRNLAYAHLVSAPASFGEVAEKSESSMYQQPALVAWKRIVISGNPNSKVASTTPKKGYTRSNEPMETPLQAVNRTMDEDPTPEPEREAFDPSTFANYSYNFIKSILSVHQPTHVLIERQRFRSGGGSAVQEWTIRVGVFEGMLHAVLKTLSEEHGLQIIVQGVDPGRVARYWLEGRSSQGTRRVGSANESKKARIDIVGESLESSDGKLVSIDPKRNHNGSEGVGHVVDAFLARWRKKDRSGKDQGTKGAGKLDDLSDCLLQGVAWLRWQNKRLDVLQRGLETFADDPLFVIVRSPQSDVVLSKLPRAARKTRIRKTLRRQAL